MLHTNITSFFLGSMNHVQAEMPPKTDHFGCGCVKHLRINGVDGVSNTKTIARIRRVLHQLSGNPD